MRKSIVVAVCAVGALVGVSVPKGVMAAGTNKLDKVARVVVQPGGSVGAAFASDTSTNFYLCSLSGSYNQVSTATCQGWLSLLTAAQLSGRSVWVEYGTTPGPNVAVKWVILWDN